MPETPADSEAREAKQIARMKPQATRNPTSIYEPSGSNYGYGLAALDGAPFFTWFDIPRMKRDPRVLFLARMWQSPFAQVTWKVKATSPQVADYVDRQFKRFWHQDLSALLDRYFWYGYAPGGAEFTQRKGIIRLDMVRPLEPVDARPLVFASGPDVKQLAGLQFGNTKVLAPHAFWFAGRKELGRHYDRPPAAGMWEPWAEKRERNGAIAMRRTWYLMNSSRGKVLRHPPGRGEATDENPQGRDYQDIARQILDYGHANSTYTLENTIHPGSPDKYAWEMEWPGSFPDRAGYRDYPKDLDEEMAEGAEIPKEVLEAASSGSGFSGRMIPLMTWYGSADTQTGNIIRSCDWLRYAVGINFGAQAHYEIEPDSLVQKFLESSKGPGGAGAAVQGMTQPPPQPPGGGNGGGQGPQGWNPYKGPNGGNGYQDPANPKHIRYLSDDRLCDLDGRPFRDIVAVGSPIPRETRKRVKKILAARKAEAEFLSDDRGSYPGIPDNSKPVDPKVRRKQLMHFLAMIEFIRRARAVNEPESSKPFLDALAKRVGQSAVELSMGFDESKHPRGQPENKGEFAPKSAAEHVTARLKHVLHKLRGLDVKPGEVNEELAHLDSLKTPELLEVAKSLNADYGLKPTTPKAKILKQIKEMVTRVHKTVVSAVETIEKRTPEERIAQHRKEIGYQRPVELSWYGVQSARGHIMAVGEGEHAGKKLYGREAESVLRNQNRQPVAEAERPEHLRKLYAAQRAREILSKVAYGTHTPQDVAELHQHLPDLPADKLGRGKGILKRQYKAVGGRHADVLNLMDEVRQEVGVMAQKPEAEPAVAEAAAKAPGADPEDAKPTHAAVPTREDGTPDKPQHGQVYKVPTGSLNVDPERFQFKLNTDSKHGVTDVLKGTKQFDQFLGGVVTVWRDPETGKDYIVNGHHRHELADRTSHATMNVQYATEAKDAPAARAAGAIVNLAEGRGTAIDAAKFLRDAGKTPADLAEKGISDKEPIVQQAAVLMDLNDVAFAKLARGQIELPAALAVAKHVKDPDRQQKLFQRFAEREEDGKDTSPKMMEQMARQMATMPAVKNDTEDLFSGFGGATEDDVFDEKAELAVYVAGQLAKEHSDWSAVANKGRAERVADVGNVLKTDENKGLKDKAEQAKNTFDKLNTLSGPISDGLVQAAVELKKAKTKPEKDNARKHALELTRAAIQREHDALNPQAPPIDAGAVGAGDSGRGEPAPNASPVQPEAASGSPSPAEVAPPPAEAPPSEPIAPSPVKKATPELRQFNDELGDTFRVAGGSRIVHGGQDAVDHIAKQFKAKPVNAGQLFTEQLKKHAEENEVPWVTIEHAVAGGDEGDKRNLAVLSRTAWKDTAKQINDDDGKLVVHGLDDLHKYGLDDPLTDLHGTAIRGNERKGDSMAVVVPEGSAVKTPAGRQPTKFPSESQPPKAGEPAKESEHSAALNAIAPGESAWVASHFIRRSKDGKFQVETGKSYKTGSAEDASDHIQQSWKDQAHDAKPVAAAMDRAAQFPEPDWTDAAANDALAARKAGVPDGARAVSLDENTKGRTGAVKVVVDPETGARTMKLVLDGGKETTATDFEPLDSKHSWRTGDGKAAEKPKPAVKTPEMFAGAAPEPSAPKEPAAPAPDHYTSAGLPYREGGVLAEDKLDAPHLPAIEKRIDALKESADSARDGAAKEPDAFAAAGRRQQADEHDAQREVLEKARERLKPAEVKKPKKKSKKPGAEPGPTLPSSLEKPQQSPKSASTTLDTTTPTPDTTPVEPQPVAPKQESKMETETPTEKQKVKLQATSVFGTDKMGKQHIAKITGTDPKYGLRREFVGEKGGKRGDYTQHETDEPGLYEVRSHDKKGQPENQFLMAYHSPKLGKFVLAAVDETRATAMAKMMHEGKTLEEARVATAPKAV